MLFPAPPLTLRRSSREHGDLTQSLDGVQIVSKPGAGVQHVSGAQLLSNDGVNLVAAALTTALGAAFAYATLP